MIINSTGKSRQFSNLRSHQTSAECQVNPPEAQCIPSKVENTTRRDSIILEKLKTCHRGYGS